MKLRSTIEQGKVKFHSNKEWIKHRLEELPDGEYEWTIKKYKKKRSLSQNAYYWAVVVTLVYEGLREAGFDDVQDHDDAHEVLKNMFFTKSMFSPSLGDLVKTVSTTEYSTTEFAEKMDEIARWAFTFLGITIPPPSSQAALDLQ